MTKEELLQIYDKVSAERKALLPKYQELLKKCFPDKVVDFTGWSELEIYKKVQNIHEEDDEIVKVFYDMAKETGELKGVRYKGNINPESSLDCLFDMDTCRYMLWDDDKGFEYIEFFRNFSRICSAYGLAKSLLESDSDAYYKDTETLHFENKNILITDPCYICKDDDWSVCGYGYNFEKLGIKSYVTRSTIYGDWSCTVRNLDTDEDIGMFCADAGLVSVFDMEEVCNYNREIDEWIGSHNWCATVIKNFTGDVTIRVGFDEKYYDFYCYVDGVGSTNFYSYQSGL